MLLLLVPAAAFFSNADLDRAGLAAYNDYRAQLTDKFAPPTLPQDLEGRRFKLVFQIGSGDATGPGLSRAYYTYRDGNLLLQTSYPRARMRSKIDFAGPARVMSQSAFVGSNAYGARARVVSRWLLSRGVAAFTAPPGERQLAWSSDGSASPYEHDYWVKIAMPPVEAKKLALDSGLLVEGTLTKFEGGGPVLCRSDVVDATVSDPEEAFAVECLFGAKVDRVAFIRRGTGEVIKEWVAP